MTSFTTLIKQFLITYTLSMKTPTNNLKHYRLLANFTQEQVSKEIGLHIECRLSRWELGKAYPSVINALKLAKLYGVTVEALYE
jgi:transcriptional regulator with XRE-family HTH domain